MKTEIKGGLFMNNLKLYFVAFLSLIFVLSSVAFGAENLSQHELDDLISRVEKGDPEAQFELGLIYYNGQNVKQNYEQAIYWLKKAAENGIVEAQHNLGVIYYNGWGTKQDYEQAFYWFKKAAEQNYAISQDSLGIMYKNGLGTKKNTEQAFFWYKKAAEQGYAEAQGKIGVMYWNGEGIMQDREQAVYWFKKAAENGYKEAKNVVSRIKITFIDASQPLNTKAQQNTAFQIREIEDALAMYYMHNGFYPSTEQGLEALVTPPTIPPLPTKNYQDGGYLKIVPNDAWGNPFVYRNFGKKIQIMSYGRDGKKGGEGLDADIANIEVHYEMEGLENLEQLVLLEGMKKSLGVPNSEKFKTKPIPTTQTEKDDYVELNPKIFKTEDGREAQATENAYTFEQKIIELADKISSSNQYSHQDMELVEGNAMVADEIVYMRAWQGKGYFFIRNYENKSWSNNHLTHFYINDKSSVNFSGRIKVGCTLDDLTAVFGDKLEWSGSDRPSEWTLTTRSEWIMNFYISSKGYVHEIQYTTVGSITSKMSLLYAFNSGELLAADVTGQKVNVRDYPDASGSNVVFQVNRSKDVLLVIDNANSHYHAVYNNVNEGWYRVVGRISGNKFIPVEGEAYVIYKYIDIRPMTNVERNMVSSALN